ncbi:hypothetical protein GF373_16615, partial [bacterium]|nr:hypothetical protein [bacterium]
MLFDFLFTEEPMRQEISFFRLTKGVFLPLFFILFSLPTHAFEQYLQDGFPTEPGVLAFEPNGQILWFQPVPNNPNDVAMLPNGTELVVVCNDGRLETINPAGGRSVKRVFASLHDVDAISNTDLLLLTSRAAKQVFYYNIKTDTKQPFDYPFDGPMDADLLPNGNLLVCDTDAATILELTPQGSVVWEFANDLKQPMDALRLPSGETLVSDFDNHRILFVRSDGVVFKEVRGFDHPCKLSLLPSGNVLVADRDRKRVVELRMDGTLHEIRDSLNSVNTAFFDPTQKLYFGAVWDRFAPPNPAETDVDVPAVSSFSPIWRMLDLFSSPYAWLVMSFLLWGAGMMLKKRYAFMKYAVFLAYGIILVLAMTSQHMARSNYPYIPPWYFGIACFLLFLYSFHDSRNSFIASRRWKSPTHPFAFPLHFATVLILLCISLAAMVLQMLQYTTWPWILKAIHRYTGWEWFTQADSPIWPWFGKVPWFLPMLAWGLGLVLLLRAAWLWKRKDTSNHAVIKFGSMIFALPALQKDRTDNYTPAERKEAHWANTAVLATVGIAILLYTMQATSVPTDVHGDEGEVALFGLDIRDQGDWNFFKPGWYNIPYLFYLIPAWVMWLFGDTLFGVRMQGAIMGVASIPMLYLLASRFFRPAAAALSAFLLASSMFMMHFSRMGIGYNQATLLVVAAMYFLVRGIQDRDSRNFCFTGILAAIGFLSYQAAKIILP